MEEYAAGGLAASPEVLVPGSGPLVRALMSMLTRLPAITVLGEMEQAAADLGRELSRQALQHALDVQAAAEPRLAEVTGADGIVRCRAEPGHARTVRTVLGDVTVTRIAYRSGIAGAPSLFPRDEVLNLPPSRYSWHVQQLVAMFAQDVSYQRACEQLDAAAGIRIGKRQAEQITIAAAADAEQFSDRQDPGQEQDAGSGQDEAGDAEQDPVVMPLVISADGKGVAMRPEARRSTATAPKDRVRVFEHRPGTGEKGHKRMAETGAVFDVQVPAGLPRTPGQIMYPDPDPRARPAAPAAVSTWYTCDITARRDVTISRVFDHAGLRDPGRGRPWIALAGGDIYQIALIEAEAARRGITITVLIDFIHVLGYLWKAGWCFHQPRDPAIEAWVTAQALAILHGRAACVITVIEILAASHPPRPGSEHDKNIRKTLHYLRAKQPYLDYPTALASGWPIATGVIEGACRHIVQDRMAITGARWGLPGAQAILSLRAINASGSTATYWDYHLQQEHHRNHTSRYQDTSTLTHAA